MQRRYDIDDVNEGIAYVAAFFTVLYYIPKVAPFINVIQGMVNFENTPGFQITICYINCLFWFLYGDLLFSDQMRIGYMVACIICLISMGIYLVYEIRKYFVDSVLNFLILVSSSWGAYRYFTVEFDDDVFHLLFVGSQWAANAAYAQVPTIIEWIYRKVVCMDVIPYFFITPVIYRINKCILMFSHILYKSAVPYGIVHFQSIFKYFLCMLQREE